MYRLLLLLVFVVSSSLGAKVLFLPSTLHPVHPFTMKHLADELAKRGHAVTWMEHGPQKSQVELAPSIERIFWQVDFDDQGLTDQFFFRNSTSHDLIWESGFDLKNERTTGWLAGVRLCEQLLYKRKQDFDQLAKRKFDTVVVDDLYNPCGLLQAALKGSVYIYWSMTSLRTESAWANQSPSPPSYLPVPGTKLTDELSLSERIFNVASYLQSLYIHHIIVQSRIDAVFQRYYPGVESAFFIERNASINFVNTPPIFDFARPYMPRVNFVGGLHCRNATKIQGDLGTFVDGASEENGFIVISSGFTAQWQRAPEETRSAFLSAIEAFPSTRFVWQFDGYLDASKKPKNLVLQQWLPLQDLLGHPKCRLHISHGGLNSVIETVWHGVPMIGFPLLASAHDNILRVSARGAGILITKREMSAKALVSAINEIRDKKYKDEMLVFQDMLRDVPYTELTHAAFWVEFIERHQEVPHARSGADKLNVFQYFLVDVIMFLLSVTAIIVATVLFVLKTILRIILWTFRAVTGYNAVKPKVRVTKEKKKN